MLSTFCECFESAMVTKCCSYRRWKTSLRTTIISIKSKAKTIVMKRWRVHSRYCSVWRRWASNRWDCRRKRRPSIVLRDLNSNENLSVIRRAKRCSLVYLGSIDDWAAVNVNKIRKDNDENGGRGKEETAAMRKIDEIRSLEKYLDEFFIFEETIGVESIRKVKKEKKTFRCFKVRRAKKRKIFFRDVFLK